MAAKSRRSPAPQGRDSDCSDKIPLPTQAGATPWSAPCRNSPKNKLNPGKCRRLAWRLLGTLLARRQKKRRHCTFQDGLWGCGEEMPRSSRALGGGPVYPDLNRGNGRSDACMQVRILPPGLSRCGKPTIQCMPPKTLAGSLPCAPEAAASKKSGMSPFFLLPQTRRGLARVLPAAALPDPG